MTFDKYEKLGAYHWECWKVWNDPYAEHARFCAFWVKERPCLDIGCGDGLITHLFGVGAVGIDSSELGVKMARERGVIASVLDANSLTGTSLFPAVFMGDILEHLELPAIALCRVLDILMPGGSLYIVTPEKSEPVSDPYHFKEYSPEELRSLCESIGFKLCGNVEVHGSVRRMYAKFTKP